MGNKKSRGNGQGTFYQDKDGVWLVSNRLSAQVLPNEGIYNVVAILSGDEAFEDCRHRKIIKGRSNERVS